MLSSEHFTSQPKDMVHASMDHTTFKLQKTWQDEVPGFKYGHLTEEAHVPGYAVDIMRLPDTPPSANDCWNSRSPSSSESAESFRSLDAHSPPRKDSLYTELNPLQSEYQHTDTSVHLHLYTDASLKLQPIQLLPSPSPSAPEFMKPHDLRRISADNRPAAEQPTSPSNISTKHPDSVVPWSSSDIRSTWISARTSFRPKSLQLRKLTKSPVLVDTPLSFATPTNTSTLEEQLASADMAWINALELPNLCLDEVDRILTSSNCLRTPDSENGPPFPMTDDIIYTTPTLEESIDAESAVPFPISTDIDNTYSNVTMLELPSPCTVRSSVTQERCLPDSHKPNNVETVIDTDGTLTCSEAEYYCEQMKLRRKYRRKRISFESNCNRRLLQALSTKIWDSEDESDISDVFDADYKKSSKVRRCRQNSQQSEPQSTEKLPSFRRLKNAQADAHLKPWWPRDSLLLTSCDNSSTERQITADDSDHIDELCCSDTDKQTIDSGHGTGVESVDSHQVQTRHSNGFKSSKPRPKHHKRSPPRTSARERRRRKQMELWQFILCRLQTASQSAFEWVNPATGVFRIKDTHAAAREWGRYRNNNRMDYEKMARAMRFYYKDSILRKARQQLHFQFAMPYVQWSERFYGPH
ncbi:hypothetical protein CSKR_102964 [Clonorchis sinensis]|uniref:Uncharacterized protein n=1 Tax=Clonorchis sinensis TaxID=79923 RepID=A0A3R7GXL7_CLOSI|nr:hypothetical protein CSKR_102964 [Clonorchis sinensis]